jgi:hypothetical protein
MTVTETWTDGHEPDAVVSCGVHASLVGLGLGPTHSLPLGNLESTHGVDGVEGGKDGIPFLREGVEAELPVSGRRIRASPGSLICVQDRKGLERGDAIQRHGGRGVSPQNQREQEAAAGVYAGGWAGGTRGLSGGPGSLGGPRRHQRLASWDGGGCLLRRHLVRQWHPSWCIHLKGWPTRPR